MLEKNEPRVPVIANYAERTLEIPHRGVSIRVLQGAAASAQPKGTPNVQWKILYHGAIIGSIRIKSAPTDMPDN